PAEGVIELYAVEQGHLSVDQCDVVQIDVTVAFPNQPVGFTLCQLGNQPLEGSMRPVLQSLELCQVCGVREQLPDLFEVLCHRRVDLLRLAPWGAGRGPLDTLMERRQGG